MHCEPVLVTVKGIGVIAVAPGPEVYFPYTVTGRLLSVRYVNFSGAILPIDGNNAGSYPNCGTKTT